MKAADRPVRQLLGQPPREVFSVQADDLVLDALKVLADHSVGAVLVLDDTKLVGVFSERDYARQGELAGRSAADTPVRELMSAEVITVVPDNTVEQCMALMTAKRVRHLPVVDGHRIVGLISIGDLVRARVEHFERIVRDLDRDHLSRRTGEAGYY